MAVNYTLQIRAGQPCLAWSFFSADQPEQMTYFYRLHHDGPISPLKRGQILVVVSYNRVRDEDGSFWLLDIPEGSREAEPLWVESKPVPPPKANQVRWHGGRWECYHSRRGWVRKD